jgi:hypothetical protein
MHPGYYVLQLELEFQLLLVSCSFNSSISVIFFAQLKINLDLMQISMIASIKEIKPTIFQPMSSP